MKILLLIFQLMPYVPAVEMRPPAEPAKVVAGTGTLLIANCRPGAPLLVEPGNLRGAVGRDGVAEIRAPAQADEADSYRILYDGRSFAINGTLRANEMTTGSCP